MKTDDNNLLAFGDWLHWFCAQLENAIEDGALLEGSFHDQEFWRTDREV